MDDEIGRTFNSIAKYVAAGPETPMTWAGSHRLEGDLATAVARLKQDGDRDLLIQGSSEVIHTLLAADLIDEMVTLTFPIILGRGKRLFDANANPRAWTLVKSTASHTGVVVSTYRRAGPVPTGSFAEIEPDETEMARRDRWAREDRA